MSILVRKCGAVYSLGIVVNWLGARGAGSARPARNRRLVREERAAQPLIK